MASIKGTNVAAMIAPFDTADIFPTHDAKYGKGGYRSVDTIAERDAIPASRLTDGCVCYVGGTDKNEYRYNEATSSWTKIEKGGGGSSVNVVDNLESTSPTDALSANQGRELNKRTADLELKVNGGTSSTTTNLALSDLEEDRFYDGRGTKLPQQMSTYTPTSSQKFWGTLFEVKIGDVVKISTYGGNGCRAWVIADIDRNIIARSDSNANLIGDNAVTLIIEQDGFVAVGCNSVALGGADKFYCEIISVVKSSGLIKDVEEIKKVNGSVDNVDKLISETENPLEIVKREVGFASIFKDWGFIGGSLCSGEHNAYGADGSNRYLDFYWYSFGQYICRSTGATGYNYSNGGQSAKSWITGGVIHDNNYEGGVGGGGWLKAQNEPKQAYIINFSSNDATQMVNGDYLLGSKNDIKPDYNDNANTFYGYYGGVIQRLQSINPKCVIFLCTYPKGTLNTQQANTGVSDAIREIATLFYNVYLIDIEKYAPSVGSDSGAMVGEWNDRYRLQFHFTAAGYQMMAWYIMNYIDWIVRHNYSAFKDVAFIGNDNAFATNDPTKWGNK